MNCGLGCTTVDNESQHWINENSARGLYQKFDTDYWKFRYFRRRYDTIRYIDIESIFRYTVSKQHYPIHMRYNQSSANCGSIRILVVFRFRWNILQMEYVMSTLIPNMHSESDYNNVCIMYGDILSPKMSCAKLQGKINVTLYQSYFTYLGLSHNDRMHLYHVTYSKQDSVNIRKWIFPGRCFIYDVFTGYTTVWSNDDELITATIIIESNKSSCTICHIGVSL